MTAVSAAPAAPKSEYRCAMSCEKSKRRKGRAHRGSIYAPRLIFTPSAPQREKPQHAPVVTMAIRRAAK